MDMGFSNRMNDSPTGAALQEQGLNIAITLTCPETWYVQFFNEGCVTSAW